MDDDVLISASEGVVSCELSDGAALLDTRSNIYYSLNPTGFRLWNALQPSSTKSGLVDVMAQEFGLDRPTAVADLDKLLTQLQSAGLIDVANASKA